jgi:hypothetical protein
LAIWVVPSHPVDQRSCCFASPAHVMEASLTDTHLIQLHPIPSIHATTPSHTIPSHSIPPHIRPARPSDQPPARRTAHRLAGVDKGASYPAMRGPPLHSPRRGQVQIVIDKVMRYQNYDLFFGALATHRCGSEVMSGQIVCERTGCQAFCRLCGRHDGIVVCGRLGMQRANGKRMVGAVSSGLLSLVRSI